MSYYAPGRNLRWQDRFVSSTKPECDGGKADYLNETVISLSYVGDDLRGLTTLFSHFFLVVFATAVFYKLTGMPFR